MKRLPPVRRQLSPPRPLRRKLLSREIESTTSSSVSLLMSPPAIPVQSCGTGRRKPMKNILLLVHDDAGQEARFQAALDITRAVGGHLTCLDVAIPPVVSGELYVFSAEAVLLADERERQAANRQRLQDRLSR